MPDALPAWTDHAVLVYGPRKGGTTLFQNLLDGSAELMVYPAELKLKLLARLPSGLMTKAQYLKETRIPEMAKNRLDVEEYRRLWDALPEAELSGDLGRFIRFDAVFVQRSADNAPPAPRLWCAKEVGGDTDKVLALWRQAFPQGKVLMILRDPRMVTRAVLRDRRRKGRRLSLWRIARETLDPLRVRARQRAHLGADWVHAVDYERLVADTPGVMREVAQFLTIPYDPAFSFPSIFGEPVVVATSSRHEKGVFASDAGWKDGLTHRELAVVASASVIGYMMTGPWTLPAKLRRGRAQAPTSP